MKGALKPEMKLGADKKKIAMLGGLLVVLVIVWWINRTDTPAAATSAPAPRPVAQAPAPGIRTPITRPRTPAGEPGSPVRAAHFGTRGQAAQEFRPSLESETPIDPAKVDPTLRTDLLAKLQGVKVEGGSRSIFDFGQATAPKIEAEKAKPVVPSLWAKGVRPFPSKPPEPPPPAPPPPPPPIPLKFYGFTAYRQGVKRAFFMEGDDIYVAGEGDTIKNRYKIIRIGVNSAVVEDINFKHEQTIPLAEEAAQQT
jgi:hypothetical protein